jgi:hypothetical protein
MGNWFSNTDLQSKIDATKQDICLDHDLTTIDGVNKANRELLESFAHFSKKDINYVKTQLFTQECYPCYI